jgi:hypothetical protein
LTDMKLTETAKETVTLEGITREWVIQLLIDKKIREKPKKRESIKFRVTK